MLKSISLTVMATLFGQVFNFFTDVLIANSFGTSWKADAYFLALVIPVILSDLFVACINAVFIPSYMERGAHGDTDEFFSTAVNASVFITAVVSAVVFFLAPHLVNVMAGKFSVEARDLTVTLTRMLLLLTLTMPLATILSCRLNAHDQFALPALGKSFNFGFIILSLLLLRKNLDIFSLPAGYVAGSVFFIAALVFLFRRTGLGYSLKLNAGHPALREMGVLALPLVASAMVNYVNVFIERSVAAGFSEGSISALNYAFKLVNAPVNLFILGGMTVIMPAFSRHAVDGDMEGLKKMMFDGLGLVSFFIMPVIACFVVFRVPIIRVLFERGAFSPRSSEVTSTALLFYSFGAFGLAAVTVMSRAFYALKEMNKLGIISACTIGFNIVLILILSRTLGFVGIPLTFSITSTLQTIIMLVTLGNRLKSPCIGPFLKFILRHGAASVLMGIVCAGSMTAFKGHVDLSSKVNLLLLMAFGGILGSIAYMAASYLLRIKEVSFILNKLVGVRG